MVMGGGSSVLFTFHSLVALLLCREVRQQEIQAALNFSRYSH